MLVVEKFRRPHISFCATNISHEESKDEHVLKKENRVFKALTEPGSQSLFSYLRTHRSEMVL